MLRRLQNVMQNIDLVFAFVSLLIIGAGAGWDLADSHLCKVVRSLKATCPSGQAHGAEDANQHFSALEPSHILCVVRIG